MNPTDPKPTPAPETPPTLDLTTPKKGLFSRLFDRLDRSLKEKADRKSQESCCGGNDNGKCC